MATKRATCQFCPLAHPELVENGNIVVFSKKLLWFFHFWIIAFYNSMCCLHFSDFHIDGGQDFFLFLYIKSTTCVGSRVGGCLVVAKIFEVLLMCCNEPEMRGWVITHSLLQCFTWAQKACTPLPWHTHTHTRFVKERGTGSIFLNVHKNKY